MANKNAEWRILISYDHSTLDIIKAEWGGIWELVFEVPEEQPSGNNG